MPVATQAAIKGLTSQQMEELGVTLILNNTYHLNLRPGIKILREAGGAHKFQGWRKNLLTVSEVARTFLKFFPPEANRQLSRIAAVFSLSVLANSQR